MSNLTPAQREKVRKNLRTLDYLQGTGVISAHKRGLVDEVFLFISTGGTGHRTLSTLRVQLEREVDSDELDAKVRFLAIDTASREIDQLRQDFGFARDETLLIPYEGAYDSINPKTISPQMKKWVDRKLFPKTGGRAGTTPAHSGFDSTGAGAWRQPGRIRLCQPNTIKDMRDKLDNLIRELLSRHDQAIKLNIFFLAGIAGGTGSGTIIDLPFLTRQIIKDDFNSALYSNTRVSAYLLLPTACGDPKDADDRASGNRNAYAALKEIDYHMGLQERKEHFCHVYNTFHVNINENIFDFCTLVEGIPGMSFEEPDKTAQRVTANSILNLIAVQKAQSGEKPFLVDSFLSDCSQQVRTKIVQKSHQIWPRDANYVYNVIGYSVCVIPIDLMTMYVANKVFEHLWSRFEKHQQVGAEDAVQFLEECGLRPTEVRRSTLDKLGQQIDQVTDRYFKEKGPYFMVNLLAEAVDVLYKEEGMFGKLAEKKANSAIINRKEWQCAAKRYKNIEQVFQKMNCKLDVYTVVIDEMKLLFRDNIKLLTNTKEHTELFEKNFRWSPIDLSTGVANTVQQYLDHLLSPKEIDDKAARFVNLLCAQKGVWCQLDLPKGSPAVSSDAAKLIRGFIQNEFSDIVNATMESFLVKLCSGDPEAIVPVLDKTKDPQGHEPIIRAANTLVHKFNSCAQTLVRTRSNFQIDDCYKKLYMTVPDSCKWLDQEIVDNVGAAGCQIYRSNSQDEIAFYRLYAGIPAWALSWVEEAERVYEPNSGDVGLHIESGERGHDWIRFPNLLHDSLWDVEYRPDLYDRESDLLAGARDTLEMARRMNLVKSINSDGIVGYEVYVFERNPRSTQLPTADELFKKAGLNKKTQYTPDQFVQNLVQQHFLKAYPLKYANEITTTTEMPPPENLTWDLACRALRRMLFVWDQVKDTNSVMKKLVTLLDQHNKTAERRRTFLNCLVNGLIEYNSLRTRWEDVSGIDRQVLGHPFDGKLQQECKEYYAAQAFYALDDNRYRQMVDALNKQREKATDEELIELAARREKLKRKFQKMRENRDDSGETSYPMASLEFEEEAGMEAEDIRDFYLYMIREL